MRYELSVVLGVLRVAVAAGVLFVAVPAFVFGRRAFGGHWPGRVAAGVVLYAVVVPVLAALRLFDLFSLTAVILGLAVLVRRGRVRTTLRAAWTTFAERVLRALEHSRSVRDQPRIRVRIARRRLWSVPVIAVAVVAHLWDVWAHPANDLGDGGAALAELRGLSVRELWSEGVRPTGVSSALAAISRVASFDLVLLLRLARPLFAVAAVAALVWGGRRLAGRPSAGVIAGVAGLLALGRGWPLADEVAAAPIAGAAAALLVVIAVVTAADDESPRWVPALAVAAASFASPPAGVALAAVLVVALVISWLIDGDRRGLLGIAVAPVAGVVPLMAGWAAGRRAYRGPGDLDRQLGRDLGGAVGLPDTAPLPPTLVLAAAGTALVALLVPRRSIRVPALCALGLLVLSEPVRFGIPRLIAPALAADLAAPALALAAGLTIDALLRHPVPRGVAAGALAATLVVSSPAPGSAGVRDQPDEVVEQLYRIKEENRPYAWTVVDVPSALDQVSGHGFFLPVAEFVDTYDPEAWRYDPEHPELAVPTRSTFLLVRRADLAADVEDETALGRSTVAVRDPAAARALERWLDAFAGDVRVRYDTDDLLVVELRRPPRDDRQFQRGGEVCLPTAADDLILPTPDEFGRCGE